MISSCHHYCTAITRFYLSILNPSKGAPREAQRTPQVYHPVEYITLDSQQGANRTVVHLGGLQSSPFPIAQDFLSSEGITVASGIKYRTQRDHSHGTKESLSSINNISRLQEVELEP